MKYIGCGIGLRAPYMADILEGRSQSDWFEVITETLLGMPGIGRGALFSKVMKIREKYPVALHGVSINIGSADALSHGYLSELRELVKLVEPCWVSDHLCWTGINGINLHDLMPLPYNHESLNHIVQKVETVQETLQRPLVLENVSSYFNYKASEMSEWDFLAELASRSGCYLLLDINNIFVSSLNQGFRPEQFLFAIPSNKVIQIHLAGPSDKGTHMIDTHDRPVREEVWALYQDFIQRAGLKSTLIERDGRFPQLSELETEVLRARSICETSKKPNGGLNESQISL